MRFSKSYFVVGIKMAKSYYDLKATKEVREAERAERKVAVIGLRTLPVSNKRYTTKAQAQLALNKVRADENVTKWLEVFEQSDVFL